MRTSEATDQISVALAQAQAALENPVRNKEATVRGKGKGGGDYEYTYNYASLDSILELIRPVLGQAKVFVTQSVSGTQAPYTLVTRVTHASGQWFETDLPLPYSGAADPRELGIAVSYARRYALAPFFFFASEEDTDTGRGKTVARKGAMAGIGDGLSEPIRNRLTDASTVVQDWAKKGKFDKAVDEWEKTKFSDPEEKAFAWSLLPSKTRSMMKIIKLQAEQAAAQAAKVTE